MRNRSMAAAALVAAGLLFAPFVVAQDMGGAMEGGKSTVASCQICSMLLGEAKALAEVRDLLVDARKAAVDAKADAVVSRIDKALAKIEARHQELHAAMKAHIAKAHDGKRPDFTCPLCQPANAHEATSVVNAYCPMQMKKLDPSTLDASKTREFEGKKVGFCCSHCPKAWDKLTDAEKREHLKKAMAMGDHHGQAGDEDRGRDDND